MYAAKHKAFRYTKMQMLPAVYKAVRYTKLQHCNMQYIKLTAIQNSHTVSFKTQSESLYQIATLYDAVDKAARYTKLPHSKLQYIMRSAIQIATATCSI
jgi:hypothetical protein